MAVEQIKEEAKKRFDQDLTDEQAEAILKSDGAEELSDQALEEVAGGANNIKINYVKYKKPDVFEPRIPEFETLKRFGFPSELTEAMLKAYDSGELSAQELEDVVGGLHYTLDVIHNGTPPGTINLYNTEELSPQELEGVRAGSDLKIRIPIPRDLLAKLESYVPGGRLKEWLDARSSEEISDQELANVAGGGCGSDGPATRDPEDDTPQNQQ